MAADKRRHQPSKQEQELDEEARRDINARLARLKKQPTGKRMLKQERDEARRAWLEEQEERKSLEESIAMLEAEQPGQALGISQLHDLGLEDLWVPPALEFIRKRLTGVPGDDPQFDRTWKQAVIDLAAREIPDPFYRNLIVGELTRFYFPDPARDKQAKQQTHVAAIEDYKNYLCRHCGMMEKEARGIIARDFGLSKSTVRKRPQRARSSGTKT